MPTDEHESEDCRSPYHHPRDRAGDQPIGRRFKIHVRDNWYRDVWLFIITAVVLYTIITARDAVEETRRIAIVNRAIIDRQEQDAITTAAEGVERRNETCRFFERQEELSVARVTRTYRFLDDLEPADRESLLVKTVVRGLPDAYAEAIANRAPEYCNERPGEPRLGLREPGPELPAKRDFRYLLTP